MEIIVSRLPFELVFCLAALVLLIVPFVAAFILRSWLQGKETIENPSLITVNLPPPPPPKPPRLRILLFVSASTTLSICCVYIIGFLLTKSPIILSSTPTKDAVIATYSKPMEILFDVPVRMDNLKINSSPVLNGEWKTVRLLPFLPLTRKIQFYPKESFIPDQKVMVYFSNLIPVIQKGWGSELPFEFYSPKLPKITAIDPQNGSVSVLPTKDVTLALSDPDGPFVSWDISMDPPLKYTIRRNSAKELKVDFDLNLSQNTPYKISVYQTPLQYAIDTAQITHRGEKQLVFEGSFQTVKAPLITSVSPQGTSVIPNAPVVIHFDEAMNPSSVRDHITMTPPLSTVPVWDQENKTLTWEGNDLAKGTTYTLTLTSGTETAEHGKSEKDVQYQFTTVGKVHVVDLTPKDTTSAIPIESSVKITFDQPVVEQSAEKAFSISPKVTGTISWEGNTMTFHPSKPLAFGTQYQVNVAGAVASRYGLDGTDTYTAAFTTAPEEVMLQVPFLKQTELFTCNIAAARMILAFKGVNIPEEELKNKVGYGGERGSGNPNKGYVTDYGTYWDPIQRAVSTYRSAHVYKDWTVTDILTQVAGGNPVQIWSQNQWSDPHDISWTTSDGTHIYAINGMHSYVIKGFHGSINNPTAIIANDPWRGEWIFNVDEFTRLWNFFKVAMIVD